VQPGARFAGAAIAIRPVSRNEETTVVAGNRRAGRAWTAGGKGGAADKIEALARAGAVIARSPAAIGVTMRDLLRG